jgi:hypothetical protein
MRMKRHGGCAMLSACLAGRVFRGCPHPFLAHASALAHARRTKWYRAFARRFMILARMGNDIVNITDWGVCHKLGNMEANGR